MSEAQASESAGEYFTRFTKRNIVLVVVLFLSNIVTAASTFITAGLAIHRKTSDWRPAEYRRVQDLRAGQTYERFKRRLGGPVYRPKGIPFSPNAPGYQRVLFHPRSEYWVEAITGPGGVVAVYTVTSCDKDFNPRFYVRKERGTGSAVRLNKTAMSDVVRLDDPGVKVRTAITQTGTVHTMSAFQQVRKYAGDRFRDFAWGVNSSCTMHSRPSGRNLEAGWGQWQRRQSSAPPPWFFPIVEGGSVDKQGRDMLSMTVVNTFTETDLNQDLSSHYPALGGIDKYVIL
ncbi:hypothetical protein ACF063_38460 [Streptomyces chartreusis]|uniref:hypothetical protein n=1 Tax=Streptomyces chartreusis TaxID=1969 RepID=UPI0037021487